MMKSKPGVSKDKSIDDYMTEICLSKTIGEVVKNYESATSAKVYWVSSLFIDAIFNKNIDAINQITQRVDGIVPAEEERDKFANLLGDAIEDVMNYTYVEQIKITPDDPCIIALAKAVYVISLEDTKNNYGKKKDKQLATDIILSRTGGRKTAPTKHLLETKYVEPEWVRLPEGESSDTTTE